MTNYDDGSWELAAEEARVRAEAELFERMDEEDEIEQSEALYSDDAIYAEEVGAEALASYNLKRIRMALGVSQQQISERLVQKGSHVRLAQTQIAKIERGERPWRLNELMEIAKVLNVKYTDFLQPEGITGDDTIMLLGARLELRRQEQMWRWQEVAWRDTFRRHRDTATYFLSLAASMGKRDADVDRVLFERWSHEKWLSMAEDHIEMEISEYAEIKEYQDSEWNRIVEEEKVKKLSAEGED